MNPTRALTIIIPILLLGVALGLGVYFLFFRKSGGQKEGYPKLKIPAWLNKMTIAPSRSVVQVKRGHV